MAVHSGCRSCLCEYANEEEDLLNWIGSAVHFSANDSRLSVDFFEEEM